MKPAEERYRLRALKQPKLSPLEWDFRTVDPSSLWFAVLWEYCRESKKVREMITDWLDRKLTINGQHTKLIRHELAEKNSLAWMTVPEQILRFDGRFATLLTCVRFDFPAPWLSGFSAHHFKDALSSVVFRDRPYFRFLGKGASLYQRYQPDSDWPRNRPEYAFHINFHAAPVGKIVAQFKEWATKEAEQFQRKTGKAQALPWEKMKWLAARRLGNELTFSQAQDFLQSKCECKSKCGCKKVLPIFDNDTAWSRAIDDAGEVLGRVESTAFK